MTAIPVTSAGSAVAAHPTFQAEGGGAIPTSALHVRKIPRHVARGFVAEHHYLHYAPPGHRISFGVFENDALFARLIGVLIWGRPLAANRLKDGECLMELTRMVILDVTERNAESKSLGISARIIRRLYPDIIGLIAYSDLEGHGHRGTIYKAAGWELDSVVKPVTWANHQRPGRRRPALTTKLRWRKALR